jgi:hypothetical protein
MVPCHENIVFNSYFYIKNPSVQCTLISKREHIYLTALAYAAFIIYDKGSVLLTAACLLFREIQYAQSSLVGCIPR